MIATFKGRRYKVVETLPVPALLRESNGLIRQYVVEGTRGATFLLQTYPNEIRKIAPTGRSESEFIPSPSFADDRAE
jgi:hypothetical protein